VGGKLPISNYWQSLGPNAHAYILPINNLMISTLKQEWGKECTIALIINNDELLAFNVNAF